jgi:hypothetical protein
MPLCCPQRQLYLRQPHTSKMLTARNDNAVGSHTLNNRMKCPTHAQVNKALCSNRLKIYVPHTVHCISVQAYYRYYLGPRTYSIQSLFYPLHHIHPSPTLQISDLATEITFLISNLYSEILMVHFSRTIIIVHIKYCPYLQLMKFIYSVLVKT